MVKIRSPIVSDRKAEEEARRILEEKKNGITEEEFDKLRNSGVIKEDVGPNEAVALAIPASECRKIPGATTVGDMCLLPIRRDGDRVEIKKLKIVEED